MRSRGLLLVTHDNTPQPRQGELVASRFPPHLTLLLNKHRQPLKSPTTVVVIAHPEDRITSKTPSKPPIQIQPDAEYISRNPPVPAAERQTASKQ